jgi:nitronate monooxygenase
MITKIKRLFKDILSCLKNNKKSMRKVARPIIQGGMGVGVSGWRLAKASAKAGAIGTVSGTAVANLLADSLQKGDPGGHFRRALSKFPFPKIAKEVLDEYFVEGGECVKRKEISMWDFTPPPILISLTICANFAFIWLAKDRHKNPIFVNYLEKIQMPHIYSILGAMLANVDGIIMGAGIPKNVPAIIDAILENSELSYPIEVKNHPEKHVCIKFNPSLFFREKLPEMSRPLFFPIVSSHVLAKVLIERCSGKIDGFVVEASTAGGHNAPPRGKLELDKGGQPIYGKRDEIEYSEFQKIGVPFWLAGSFAHPEGLRKARVLGAFGIQVGTLFAFSKESGIESNLKTRAIMAIYRGIAEVFTSPVASPTGFPFKVLCLEGTLSEKELYQSRRRICSLGYLREAVWLNEKIVFRCKAEPVSNYVRKGGNEANTKDSVCICAGLCATVDARRGEIPILTAGDDLSPVWNCMSRYLWVYTAKNAVRYILGK